VSTSHAIDCQDDDAAVLVMRTTLSVFYERSLPIDILKVIWTM